MKLLDLHTLLQDSIVNLEPLINPFLQKPPKGTIEERVDIYASGFYGRLTETLNDDYAALAALMGEDEFNALCYAYIRTYPSHSYTLNSFGEKMSRFLLETAPYKNKPYLAEIALFEYAESTAITARDADLLIATDLQTLPLEQWPEMKFYLHPSCQFLMMHWNSLSLITEYRSMNTFPKPKRLKTPQSLILWRRQQDVRYCVLGNLEHTLLHAVKKQLSFADICALLSKELPEEQVATYLVKELYAWLTEELFIQCESQVSK